jgi:hypothetical protein
LLAADSSTVVGHPASAMSQIHPQLRRVLTRSAAVAKANARHRAALRAQFVAACTLTAGVAVAAAVVWYLDRRDGKHHLLGDVPLFSWLLVAAMLFPVIVLAKFVTDGAVFVLEAALSAVFPNVHYVLTGLRSGLQCAPATCCHGTDATCRWLAHPALPSAMQLACPSGQVPSPALLQNMQPQMPQVFSVHVRVCLGICRILVAALVLKAVMTYLVTRAVTEAPTATLLFLERFTLCAVIFSSVELVKDLAARLLSLRVHSGNMFEALEARRRFI